VSGVRFEVDVEPRGWARPRKDGRNNRWYVDNETAAHKEAIAWAFRQAVPGRPAPHDGPVAVTVMAFFRAPKSWPLWKRDALVASPAGAHSHHTNKPDADNVSKAVLDALNGLAWVDDAQVCSVDTHKHWAIRPHYRIVIQHLELPAATLAEFRRTAQ
jgi:Holliday junction resolvase RusA-like endonuclease